MAYLNFPDKLFIKTLDSNEESIAGGLQFNTNQELRYLRLGLLIHGGVPTTETITLELHAENTCNSLIASSDSVLLSDIGQTTNYWSGMVRFDFDRININLNQVYWVNVVSANYTRNANTYYLGYIFDWPDGTFNTDTSDPLGGAKFQPFGYREST